MVLADKGYTSKANREHIVGHGLKDGTVRKATKGKPLEDKESNRQISQYRLSVLLEVSDAALTEEGVDIGD